MKRLQLVFIILGAFVCTFAATYSALVMYNNSAHKKRAFEDGQKNAVLSAKRHEEKQVLMEFRKDIYDTCKDALETREITTNRIPWKPNRSWKVYDISCDLVDPSSRPFRIYDKVINFHYHNGVRCLCRGKVSGTSMLLETHVWYY